MARTEYTWTIDGGERSWTFTVAIAPLRDSDPASPEDWDVPAGRLDPIHRSMHDALSLVEYDLLLDPPDTREWTTTRDPFANKLRDAEESR